MEELQSRVTSLIEERGQLQEILEGLMQEKKQLTAELEDTMGTLQTEVCKPSFVVTQASIVNSYMLHLKLKEMFE